MIPVSDFEGLQRDLNRRADVIRQIIQRLNANWGAIDWSGPRHDAFRQKNAQVMSVLAELESTLSNAAWNAGIVAHELATEIGNFERKAGQVLAWLHSEATKMGSDVEALSRQYFGMPIQDLPPTVSPQWGALYTAARVGGLE